MADEQAPAPAAEASGEEARAGVLRTLRELPRPTVVLLFGIALNRMGSFIALFLVLYLTSLGYRPSAAGLALTSFGAGSIAGTFAGGAAADRLGPRRTIVVSMLLSSVAIAAIAGVRSLIPLLPISFAAGGLTQTYRPAAMTMLAELTPPSRLIITSAASRLGLNVGAAIAPLIGVWLISYSYRAAFVVNAAVSLAFAIVAWAVLPGPVRHEAQAAAGLDAEDSGTTRGGASHRGPAEKSSARYRDLLSDHRFMLVIGAMFVTAIAEVQCQTILPLEIRHRGLPTVVYAAVMALNGALVIAVELPLTGLIQRLSMRLTISSGCLLLGCGLALFGIPAGAWIFFAGTVVWTAGEIVSAPSIAAYPALAAPEQRLRSRYIGALATCQSAGWAIGPSIGTTVFQASDTAAFIMCAGLGAIAFLGMRAGVSEKPRSR